MEIVESVIVYRWVHNHFLRSKTDGTSRKTIPKPCRHKFLSAICSRPKYSRRIIVFVFMMHIQLHSPPEYEKRYEKPGITQHKKIQKRHHVAQKSSIANPKTSILDRILLPCLETPKWYTAPHRLFSSPPGSSRFMLS